MYANAASMKTRVWLTIVGGAFGWFRVAVRRCAWPERPIWRSVLVARGVPMDTRNVVMVTRTVVMVSRNVVAVARNVAVVARNLSNHSCSLFWLRVIKV